MNSTATEHILLAALWIIYCVLHSWLATNSFKRTMQHWMGNQFRHYRLLYTLFAFVSLAAIILYQLTIQEIVLFQSNSWTDAAGIIIAVSGAVIMGICIRKYFIGLSGIKSLISEQPVRAKLIISGVHQYIRHPLYLGTFIFIWGLLLFFPVLSLLLTNTVITLYTLAAIKLEEAKLIAEFGDDYRKYQADVPMILPGIGAHRKK